MHWPQITMIILYGLSLGINAAKDGQPKTGKHSFWSSLLGCALGMWILSQGGFFNG